MIPVQQAKAIFTKAYLAAFKEKIPVPSFLKTFFNVETTRAKTVSIEVQRGTERIAVDVLRGTDGNRNQFSRWTEKEYMPPFFNENFDATSLDRYDRLFGVNPEITPEVIGYLANDISDKLMTLRDKIERAKEKQAAQVFETGIVELINGDNIDFKRKAESKVDLGSGGDYWSVTTAGVEADLIAGAEFIRNKGKNGSPIFNLVMSGTGWINLKNTNYFADLANFQQVQLIDVNMPQKESFGAGYMGRISAGAYLFDVWTYDEIYEAAGTGTITRYWPVNYAFMTPSNGTRFTLAHAGVPAIIRDKSNAEFAQFIIQQASEYWINNYIDNPGKAHIFEIMSAPLAVPITIDMIYTMQILA